MASPEELQAATFKRQFSEANTRAKNLTFRLTVARGEIGSLIDELKFVGELISLASRSGFTDPLVVGKFASTQDSIAATIAKAESRS
jgi:hypothetical protein